MVNPDYTTYNISKKKSISLFNQENSLTNKENFFLLHSYLEEEESQVLHIKHHLQKNLEQKININVCPHQLGHALKLYNMSCNQKTNNSLANPPKWDTHEEPLQYNESLTY